MNHNFEDLYKNKKKSIEGISKENNIKKNELIFQQALDFHQRGNIEDAKKYYSYLIKKEPIDQRALLNLGAIFQQSGEFDKAIKIYNNLIKLNPNSSDVLSNLGLIYRDIGKLSEAENLLRKSLTINPKLDNALFNLCSVLVKI